MHSFADILKNISGITLDSRLVEPGMLFCAYPGEKADGRDFIAQAIEKGAERIAYEPRGFAAVSSVMALAAKAGIECLPVEDLQHQVGRIASEFYASRLSQLHLTGVTGTNGKTSVTHYLAQAWQRHYGQGGVLGTVGFGVYAAHKNLELTPLPLTTPDPITLMTCLVAMQQQGAEHIAMEVSAHALTQGRVNGLHFDTAVFMNLTQDHLDYYGTMAQYGQAKAALFQWPQLRHAVINVDDPYSQMLLPLCSAATEVVVFGQNKPAAQHAHFVWASDVVCLEAGYRITLTTSWGGATIETGLIGRFNISNLLATLAVLLIQGVSFPEAVACVSRLHAVPGRMQFFGGGIKPRVIVDYAHTPDALEKALLASREHLKGHLFCVFGCGGERDPLKRPLMTRIAQTYADKIIMTQDNPRNEPWATILADMEKGITDKKSVVVLPMREEAIQYAISQAKAEDVILVAGKGHENYQIIGDQKIAFSDAVWVQKFLQELDHE